MIFVGERRSKKAIVMDVQWSDGRLAAKQLFDALQACGIDPRQHEFCNAFERGARQKILQYLNAHPGEQVVGMGQRAQGQLAIWAIPYIKLIHPAARGAIRKKERYIAHVRQLLGG